MFSVDFLMETNAENARVLWSNKKISKGSKKTVT